MRKAGLAVAILAMAVAPMWARAQANSDEKAATPATHPPEHFYRLTFAVEEVNDAGKITNARSYVETISMTSQRPQQIRTGAKIPVAVSDNQWNYMDVGVDFDVFGPKEVDNKLTFDLSADISSLASAANGGPGSASHPVVRQNRWSSNVVIAPGKPTVVFSSDDLEDKGKMQVEVTAARVD
jgi:hypothetical protein